MKRIAVALAAGLGAGVLLFGAYVGARYWGVPIGPDQVAAGAAALAFASTTAVFVLIAIDRKTPPGVRARLLLNDMPAKEYVYPFDGPNLVQLLVRPGMSPGEILGRHDELFGKQPHGTNKGIVLTIKGSKKQSLATITLQQVFLMLKPYKLEHVLLVGDRDGFIGYIPGDRAAKEFTGNDAAEKVTKFIVKVIDNPDDCAVLRSVSGTPKFDTIDETDDTRLAEAKVWANESIRGLVVHRSLKPCGYISRENVLRLNAARD